MDEIATKVTVEKEQMEDLESCGGGGAAAAPAAPVMETTTLAIEEGEEKTEIEVDDDSIINNAPEQAAAMMAVEPTTLRSAVTLSDDVILALSGGHDSNNNVGWKEEEEEDSRRYGKEEEVSTTVAAVPYEQWIIEEKKRVTLPDDNNRTSRDTTNITSPCFGSGSSGGQEDQVAIGSPIVQQQQRGEDSTNVTAASNHGSYSSRHNHAANTTSPQSDCKRGFRRATSVPVRIISPPPPPVGCNTNPPCANNYSNNNDTGDLTSTTLTIDDSETDLHHLSSNNSTPPHGPLRASSTSFHSGVPGAYRAGGRPSNCSSSFGGSSTSRSFRYSHSSQHRQSYYRSPDGSTLVNAFRVDSDDGNDDMVSDRELLKEEVRREIMLESMGALKVQVVDSSDSSAGCLDTNNINDKKHKCLIGWILFLLVALATAVGVTLGIRESGDTPDNQMISSSSSKKPGSEPDAPIVLEAGPQDTEDTSNDLMMIGLSTLERIRKRGYVNCGVPIGLYGLGFNPEPGVQQGMNIEHCQAIALTAVGNSSAYRLTYSDLKTRFQILHNNSVDVLTTTITHTMGRDVYHPEIGSGLSFSVPYLYTGMAFGGIPEYVDCADQLDTLSGNCRNLRVCVAEGSSHALILQEIFPKAFTVLSSTWDQIQLLNDGTCNVMVRDSVSLPSVRVRADGYNETLDYKIGKRVFSREPLAMVTRQDDPEWTSLVNSVIELFFTAEAQNLTSTDARALMESGDVEPLDPQTSSNNHLYDRMVRLVAEFGNYAELYERTLEYLVPRDYPNYLDKAETENMKDFNRSSGMMYYFPFGNLDAAGVDPVPGKTLERVSERGSLICGIRHRPGFAEYNDTTLEWSGLDIEFCKALNAAIHLGETDYIQYVDVGTDDEEEVTAEILKQLSVDVIAGERVTLEKSVMSSLSFSSPYYYDNQGQAFAFATASNDPQWTDFVFWTVMATVYAEENGITMQGLKLEPGLMPSVSLFGERFKPMFYDSISAVGSYAEIYERSLQALVPRTGANLLNKNLSGPQQFPLPLN